MDFLPARQLGSTRTPWPWPAKSRHPAWTLQPALAGQDRWRSALPRGVGHNVLTASSPLTLTQAVMASSTPTAVDAERKRRMTRIFWSTHSLLTSTGIMEDRGPAYLRVFTPTTLRQLRRSMSQETVQMLGLVCIFLYVYHHINCILGSNCISLPLTTKIKD